MIAWHLCLSVRGGGGEGVVISHLTPHHPHPFNLSHIYDSLTFMFECQGWGGGGSYFSFNPSTIPPLKFKSYLWYPDIYVWLLGVGDGGSIKNGEKILQIQNWMLSTPDIEVISIIPWHLCLSVRGGVVVGVYKK